MDYNKNQQRLSEVRRIMSFVKLVGDKKPEDVLQDVNYAIKEVNNNFNLEHIDKLVSFNLDDKNLKQDLKDEKDEKDEKDQDSGRQENEKSETIDTNTENKIKNNKQDILKYMKLIEKYKDNPEKCKDFKRAMNDLQKENKKLYDTLNKNQSKDDFNPPQLKNTINSKEEPKRIEKKEEPKRIEKKEDRRPEIVFDRKTGNYTYYDENGKATDYDFFYQRTGKKGKKEGKYYDKITKSQKKHIMEYAISKGLTKQQAKMMDDKIYMILVGKNPQLLDKYIESLKGNKTFDKGFDILYDLRKRDRDIERNIGFKNMRNIIKKAKEHEKLGIARVFKDKSRAPLYGLLAGLVGAAAIGTGTYKLLNSENEEKTNIEGILENADELAHEIKEKSNIPNTDSKSQKDEKDLTENEENQGGFIKISEGAMLFRDPTDELRIMSGENANEQVQLKKSSPDKLYQKTKTGYYSPSGEYVTIEPGQSLEEVLKEKGLDRSFIEDENTIKMYHVVASGIAQWVNAEDVEEVELKVDKFGNVIEKTDEEKEVEEAYESYMQQNSKSYKSEQAQR